MAKENNTNIGKAVPWYEYYRGGLLEPLAVQPKYQIQPQTGCCGGKGVEDSRLKDGPEPNNGIHDPKSQIRPFTYKHNRVIVVLNPFAGKGRGSKIVWPKLKTTLQKANIAFELFETQRQGHAIEYFAKTASSDGVENDYCKTLEGFDAVLVIGGDGTVNEVANGLLKRQLAEDGEDIATAEMADNLLPIGILPGGTGNSTLVALGMMNSHTNDVQLAIDAVVGNSNSKNNDSKLSYVKFDIAKCVYGDTTRYILQLFGWGLGVDANIRAETLRWMGPARYDIAAVMEIFSGKKRNLSIKGKFEHDNNKDGSGDDENSESNNGGGNGGASKNNNTNEFELSGDYAITMIMNCEIGGADMRLTPYAKVNDGYFDIMAAKGRSRFDLLKLFDALKQNGCHVYQPEVHSMRFSELTLDTPGEQ